MSNSDSVLQGKNFFASLFDLSFRSFVALRFIKILYVILIVILGIVALLFLITGISSGDPATILLTLILVPLGALVYLIVYRVVLELIVVIFRIAENTSILVDRSSGSEGPGQSPPSSPF